MLRQYKLSDYRFRLILLVIALSIFGILIIGSANSIYQTRQILGLVLGLAAMVFISLMDYTWILNFYWDPLLYRYRTAYRCAFSWKKCKRSHALDHHCRTSVPAIRYRKDPSDFILCKIL